MLNSRITYCFDPWKAADFADSEDKTVKDGAQTAVEKNGRCRVKLYLLI